MTEETPYPTSQQIRHAIDVRFAESDNEAAKLVAAHDVQAGAQAREWERLYNERTNQLRNVAEQRDQSEARVRELERLLEQRGLEHGRRIGELEAERDDYQHRNGGLILESAREIGRLRALVADSSRVKEALEQLDRRAWTAKDDGEHGFANGMLAAVNQLRAVLASAGPAAPRLRGDDGARTGNSGTAARNEAQQPGRGMVGPAPALPSHPGGAGKTPAAPSEPSSAVVGQSKEEKPWE